MSLNPQGATPAYAAPELLRSLQLQCEGAGPAHPGLLINGFAADYWAVGIVLFELLTGELPFRGKAATKALECLDSLCKEQWEDYEGVLQAQQSWVSMPLLTASPTPPIHWGMGHFKQLAMSWMMPAGRCCSIGLYGRVKPCFVQVMQLLLPCHDLTLMLV